ncbi:hypothetical protein ONE63_000070 [Megalurothrips usitatus]|uniref:Uncharacterized protein n=1 Tax=Megalurothrips usitatus TaxID=439358 RepID=A0AAV7XXB9_9NEOP|nr:hypothetical protein ONE63_000070 [Megalurothrips usitatus]
MHGVFLGVCRLLVTLWFSSAHSGQPWSLHHMFDVVDEKLRKIKPPSFIPVLKGIMEDRYLYHHCKLVSAICLLTQDTISPAQIEAAKVLIVSYVADFARLYSLRYLGINVHQLLHLPKMVLDLGPLWVYNCFFLESFNGKLSRLFHGTQHVALQICSSISMLMQVPTLIGSLPPASKALEFCRYLESYTKSFKLADQIDNVTVAVGTYSRNAVQIRHSIQVLNRSMDTEYSVKSQRKESSFVAFDHDNTSKLGQILRFVRWSGCGNVCEAYCRNCPLSYIAIIEVYERQVYFVHDLHGVRLPYMHNVQKTESIVAVPVHSIQSLCFYIDVGGEKYIASPVNSLEIE